MSSAISTSTGANLPPLTALAAALEAQGGKPAEMVTSRGGRTPESFGVLSEEIDSLLHSAGLLDLGFLRRFRITGDDRLRWLNGMVTNAVQALPEGEGNYSFLLNSQGRIQGDGYTYRRAGDLLFDTGRDQLPSLLRHLARYIIMDDVELEDVSEKWTALGLAGPKASEALAAAGIPAFDRGVGPGPGSDPGPDPGPDHELHPASGSRERGAAAPEGNRRLRQVEIAGVQAMIIEAAGPLVPRFEIWFSPAAVLPIWEALKRAGAKPAGLRAAEALRILEGTPLYGVDLSERDLPQESGQWRALSFSKGCYLGQEIVERIRSRGNVHRRLRQFSLEGALPALPAELRRAGQGAGKITSAVSLSEPGIAGNFALGFLREQSESEREESNPKETKPGEPPGPEQISYDGGVAVALEAPPPLAAYRETSLAASGEMHAR